MKRGYTEGMRWVLLMLLSLPAMADGERFDASLTDGVWTFCEEGGKECQWGCGMIWQPDPKTQPSHAWPDGGYVFLSTATGGSCAEVIGTYRCDAGYSPNMAAGVC